VTDGDGTDADLEARGIAGDDAGRAVYVISVAAELAGVHPRLCGSTSARVWLIIPDERGKSSVL